MRVAELRARRAASQLLDAGKRDPEAIVGALLAVQAQDARAARLALRARGRGLAWEDVDRAGLVASWLLRGTLHLVRRDDLPWLLGLTAPTRFAASRRRLGQEGVSPADADRAVGVIERALGSDGPLTRAQLAERLASAGMRTEGQATPHLLMLAALRGLVVLVGERFTLVPDPPRPLEGEARSTALAELARRYMQGHGPATVADLAAWAGLALRDARAGLAAVRVRDLGGGLVDLPGRSAMPEPPPPRLLGAFDPYLLGWKDRSFAVPAAHARAVHPGGGVIRAVALREGRVVGTWRLARGRALLDAGGFDAERADVERFLA